MPKNRAIIEKIKGRPEYKNLSKAQEATEQWRFPNDADWTELMKTMTDCYYYRVVNNANLPKCVPNVFKTFGSISAVFWVELMVGSGCFTRFAAQKAADRGQGEACASACRIPILETLMPNTTCGEICARIRRNRGMETSIYDVMPFEESDSGDETPSYHSPVAVTKKTQQICYPLVAKRESKKAIPAFAHQYKKSDSPDIPNLDIPETPGVKLEYVGEASRQLGAGAEKKKLKNKLPDDYMMGDSQGVNHDYSALNKKRSSEGASSSTTLPSYFEMSPLVNASTKRRSTKPDILKKLSDVEKARSDIVSVPISEEDRKDPSRMQEIRKDRLKKLNSIRMGPLGIPEELWDQPIDSEDDDILLDISHVKHEKPDPEAVAAADAEIAEIALTSKTKSNNKSPPAPKKEKVSTENKVAPTVLSDFDDEKEIDQVERFCHANKDVNTQQLPGISSADLAASEKANADSDAKRRKIEDDVTSVESSEDALKNELAQ